MEKNTNRDKRWYKWLYLGPIVLLAIGLGWLWQTFSSPVIVPISMTLPSVAISQVVNEPIQPIPLTVNLDEKKVNLGKKLFHDPILSGNHQVSCATCHNLQLGGVDRLTKAIGIDGKVAKTNTLTVFNSSFNHRLDWDGKFADLQAQITSSINNPVTMGSSWPQVLANLARSASYQELFKQVYKTDINQHNVVDAIATYEMSLITPNSRFDKFLRGDQSALTVAEKQGYQAFKNYGCISCHQGVNVGGNIFQRFGVLGDYFADRGDIGKIDLGRFNVTNMPQDIYVFRVPSLRNVALTYPYFHDGSASTLETAITIMAKYQLGREISAKDLQLIAQFLHTLTGEYQGKPL